MSVNKAILLGNVGRDPEIRYIEQRTPLASFPLATSEKPANGGPEITEWHNIIMWGPAAEAAERYIRKGTKLYVEGRIKTRYWEDRNAIKRTVTEIYADHFEILGRPAPTPPQP